jgi:hypothetical protein
VVSGTERQQGGEITVKIFISWSGPISKQIAQYLHEWPPMVLQYIRPYMSSEDNETGTRWFNSVSMELQSSNFGILCLTRDNLTAPWIHFEAGAISKVTENSRVAPMLFQLQPSELPGPLTQFQAKAFDKDGIYDLLKSINHAAGEEALDTNRLERMFAALWDQLNNRIGAIPDADHDVVPERLSHRTQEVEPLLEQILVLARQQSISSSDGFRRIVDLLHEETNELRRAINLAIPESAESRRAFDDLLENWRKFLETLAKFAASPKIVESGVLQENEFKELVGATTELSVLLDRTSLQSRWVLNPIRAGISSVPLRKWSTILGGAFEPPYPPPKTAGEKSGEEP